MGASLMVRWGRRSAELTWTGASGAPMTPRRRRRSERRNEVDALAAAEGKYVTEGARDSWSRTQRPHPSFLGQAPTSASPPSSGPSMRGARVSRKLTDLATSAAASGGSVSDEWRPWAFLRRGRSIAAASATGDWPLPELLSRNRAGDNPRTTSSFRADKKPCSFSMDLLTYEAWSAEWT